MLRPSKSDISHFFSSFESQILLILLIWFTSQTNGDVFTDVMRSENPCKDLCNGFVPFKSARHNRQICERGCHFYNSGRIKDTETASSVKEMQQQCYYSCAAAYDRSKDTVVCNAGCDLIVKQKHQRQTSEDASTDIWVVYIGQEGSTSNSDEQQPIREQRQRLETDLESELLVSDPVLRNQVEWSYGVEYKIPETHIRTMPIGGGDTEFGLPNLDDPSNPVESDTVISQGPGGAPPRRVNTPTTYDWLDCASRNSGLPKWLLGTAVIIAIMVALWICIAPERPRLPSPSPSHHHHIVDVPLPVFSANDVQFTPPPKYTPASDKV